MWKCAAPAWIKAEVRFGKWFSADSLIEGLSVIGAGDVREPREEWAGIGSDISAESPARKVARVRLFSMEWKCLSRTERRICFNGIEMVAAIGANNILQFN